MIMNQLKSSKTISSSVTVKLLLLISTTFLVQATHHTIDSDENIGNNIDEFPNSDGEFPKALPAVNNSNGTITNSSLTEGEEEYEESNWEDGNWRRKDKSKIAQVIVYSSVILIALVGVLVKYFVTQYETLQAKAQMEYQQLRNVQCH